MPFGRGRSGWGGAGMGRDIGFGRGIGRGMGRGNPYPFCRFNPRLPRRWWAFGGGYYQATQLRYYGWSPYYKPPTSYP